MSGPRPACALSSSCPCVLACGSRARERVSTNSGTSPFVRLRFFFTRITLAHAQVGTHFLRAFNHHQRQACSPPVSEYIEELCRLAISIAHVFSPNVESVKHATSKISSSQLKYKFPNSPHLRCAFAVNSRQACPAGRLPPSLPTGIGPRMCASGGRSAGRRLAPAMRDLSTEEVRTLS